MPSQSTPGGPPLPGEIKTSPVAPRNVQSKLHGIASKISQIRSKFRGMESSTLHSTNEVATNKPPHGPKVKPPISDGSEEFFEQFTPRVYGKKSYDKSAILLSLGLTLGLIAGAGTTLWLRKRRKNKPWWRRLFKS